MDCNKLRTVRRLRRKRGTRKNLYGSTDRPRMTIYRSNKNIYAQVINDVDGKTLVSASSVKMESGGNVEAAKAVGTAIAEAAKAEGIEQVAFDRNGYLYHGRIKALADAAREAGLNF